jgi:hypothetical protein
VYRNFGLWHSLRFEILLSIPSCIKK